jgi:hypothetical protein
MITRSSPLAGELTLPPSAGGGPVARTELQVRYARGEGIIVDGSSAPFHDALIHPAAGSDVLEWQQRETGPHAQLRLGELALAPGVPCVADAAGFNRHTFLCGQSGSGKTYSLGVILERLLTETDLRMVIFDPNSDFTRLGEVRPDADPALAGRYRQAARGVAIYSAGAHGERRLRLHAADVEPATQAAALRLSPIADQEERGMPGMSSAWLSSAWLPRLTTFPCRSTTISGRVAAVPSHPRRRRRRRQVAATMRERPMERRHRR